MCRGALGDLRTWPRCGALGLSGGEVIGVDDVVARRPAGVRTAGTVQSLEAVQLGGVAQWILVRGHDTANPIVLFLHGGPGTSQLTANKRDTKELEASFTVVNWDQRGAGKSYAAIRDVGGMRIEQFVSDTRALSLRLLERFGHERLVLVGHSWGSVVGALTAARYPELFHCYVGIGQVGRMAEGERLSYEWTLAQARERAAHRAVSALEAMGPPPYSGDWQRNTITQRRYLAKFGGEVHGKRSGAMAMVLHNVLISREYGVRDRLNVFRGVLGSMKLLWPELMQVDLFTQAATFAVPVFLVEGRHDWEVPSVHAAQYFDALTAPTKELVWFERSAHLPNHEERERFTAFMLHTVRPLALA